MLAATIPESPRLQCKNMAADVQLRLDGSHRLQHQDTILVMDDDVDTSLHPLPSTSPSNTENNYPAGNSSITSSELTSTSILPLVDTSNQSSTSCSNVSSTPTNYQSKSNSRHSPSVTSQSSSTEKVKYGELVVLGYV